MRHLTLILLGLTISCSQPEKKSETPVETHTIAFGSCSKQNLVDQQLWKEVLRENPSLWIWLGDNIYGDSEDMQVMKEKYDLQKSHPDYQQLIAKTDIIGIWDDHDFGVNDGGKEYPKKNESKELLFDFLDVDPDNTAWNRDGAYQSYSYEMAGNQVKVILLDTRYFRDSLLWQTEPKQSLVNETGDILGEAQWKWFEGELDDETIDLFLIGTGIQVITTEHGYEKWSNFPLERARLLSLIQHKVNVPTVFLSGDRHISEVSKLELGNGKYPIYDLTSSSLTSPWGERSPSPNSTRIGELIYPVNFAVMDISWREQLPSLKLKFVGRANEVLQEFSIDY